MRAIVPLLLFMAFPDGSSGDTRRDEVSRQEGEFGWVRQSTPSESTLRLLATLAGRSAHAVRSAVGPPDRVARWGNGKALLYRCGEGVVRFEFSDGRVSTVSSIWPTRLDEAARN